MIRIDRVTTTDYSLTVHYNDGEEELTVHCSSGQDGRCYWMMVRTGVDGTLGVVGQPTRSKFRNFRRDTGRSLTEWAIGSVGETEESRRILVAMVHYEIGKWMPL